MPNNPLNRALAAALALLWAATLLLQLAELPALRLAVAALLALFLIGALFLAGAATLALLAVLAAFAVMLLIGGAPPASLIVGLERTLIFAALLPTLRLARACVRRLPAAQLSQQRIAALPARHADAGILLAAQTFGAVLNTGAFALVAAVAADAGPARRLGAALAALRGMNLAVLWSPFFIGYAVAQTYLPEVPAWQLLPLGLLLTGCALLLALLLFARPLTTASLAAALRCVLPVLPTAAVAAAAVVTVAATTALNTIGAVLIVVPLLCLIGLLLRPAALRPVLSETRDGLYSIGDDLLIVAAAMLLGSVAETAPLIGQQIAPWLAATLPSSLVIATVIGVMTAASIGGVHPMISGVVLMVSFSGGPVAELALMEAMLVGWGLGTMTSISSLSVVTVGALFDVPRWRLAFSANLVFVVLFAAFASLALSAVDRLLRAEYGL